MLSKIKQLIAYVLISAFLIQPTFASSEKFFFRYKPGPISVGYQPQIPDDEEEDRGSAGNYDVDAHFYGMVGAVFNSTVPTKPGAQVVSWEASGILPTGLSFNNETGNISGTPVSEVVDRKLTVTGYGPSGGMDTYASVTINIAATRDGAVRQDFFARTARDFFTSIEGREDVFEWKSEIPLPSWARIEHGYLTGRPSQAGQWPVGMVGIDYNGREVKFVYGNIIVDDGPSISFIPDHHQHVSDRFNVVPSVNRSVGNILWSVEGKLPQSLTFDPSTGKIDGYIDNYSTHQELRFRAIDLGDGSSGLSNSFVLSTQDPAVKLDRMSRLDFTVNSEKYIALEADEVVGDQVWSLAEGDLPPGISLNEVSGEIGGIPTTVGEWDGIVVRLTTPSSIDQSNPFTIEVFPDRIVGSVPALHVRTGEAFSSEHPDVSGGVGPYSFEAGSGVSTEVVFDADTGGFSGSIGEKGNHSFSIIPKDQTGRDGTAFQAQLFVYEPLSADVEQDLYVFERLQPVAPIRASTPSYSAVPNVKWQLLPANRALPNGLVFHESGVISGKPEADSIGHYGMYQMEVEDGSGTRAQTRSFQIHIVDIDPMEIDARSVTFPRLTPHSVYMATVTSNVGQVTFSIDESSAPLPQGLRIDADGRLTGTTTAIDDVEGVVVRAVDEEGREAISDPVKITFRHPDPMEISSVSFTWAENIEFETPTPRVQNAVGDLIWEPVSSLPSWASLNDETGQISGNVDVPGVYGPYSLRATDVMGRSGSAEVTINVLPPLEVTIAPEILGNRLSSLDVKPTVSNAVGALTWQIESVVPSGTSFSRGTISGTPLEEGSFSITLNVVDRAGQERSVSTTLIIRERLPLTLGYGNRTVTQGREALIRPNIQNAAGGVRYTLAQGTLPTGLRLNASNGLISGIATQAGYWRDLIVMASDRENVTASSSPFTIKVTLSGEITVANPTIRTTRVNQYFTSSSIPVGNVLRPIEFSTNFGGPLPDSEIALIASNGQLSGTPSTVGQRNYSLKVIDHLERSKTFQMQLKVVDALKVTMSNMAFPLYGKVAIAPVVTNAVGRLNWSITSGALPEGLAINPSTGAITGYAEQQGSFSLVLEAEDQFDRTTASAAFTLTIGARVPLNVTMANISTPQYSSMEARPVVSGVAFSYAATLSPQNLPDGMEFDTTTGRIYGQPTEIGDFGTYTITVTDARGGTASRNFSLVVGNRVPLSVNYGTLRPIYGKSYVSSLPSVTGAYGSITYSVEGDLPQGMTFNRGRFQGMPTEVGQFEVQVTAADLASSVTVPVVLKVSYQNSMKVANPAIYRVRNSNSFVVPPPSISNGVGARTYTAVSGLHGLELDTSTGRLSGAINLAGTYAVTLSVEDEIGQKADFTRTIRVYGDLAATLATSSTVLANHPFSMTPKYSNAIGDLSWEIAEGTLPTGLALRTDTGAITGTATELGMWSGVVLRARDVDGDVVSTSPLTLDVVLDGNPISLATAAVTTKPGFPFQTNAPVVGNTIGDWSFRSPQAEALGLSVDPETGVISGIIQSQGDKVIDLDVTDSTNRVTSQAVVLTVLPMLRVTYSPEINTTVNRAMTATLPSVQYNIGSITYSLEGRLPSGLVFTSSNGRISGTSNEQGLSEPLRVIGTDSLGDVQASNWFRINVLDDARTPTINNPASLIATAGTHMSTTVPITSHRKIGDIFSINKELPSGLVLNTANGVISGTPSIGSQGIYDGYSIRITDINGRFSETASFTISVRSDQDAAFKVYKKVVARKGAVVSTPIPSYYPEHVVGNVTYTQVSGLIGTVDEFGVWTGTANANSNIRIRPRDEIGNHAEFVVQIEIIEPEISYAAIEELGGTSVNRSPVLSNILGTPSFRVISNNSTLAMDQETGELSGNIGYGDRSIVVRVTDSYDGMTKDFTLRVAGTVQCNAAYIKNPASVKYSSVNRVDDFTCRFNGPQGRVGRATSGTFYELTYDSGAGSSWCREVFKNISSAAFVTGENDWGRSTKTRINSSFSAKSSTRAYSSVTCKVPQI